VRLWAHAVFAAVLVGSLASRERSAEAPVDSAGLESAALGVARSQGLTFRDYRESDTDWGRTMAFDVLGCAAPLLATWRPATFEDEATTQSALRQGYARQYVYFDRKWNRPNRWAVSIQRMKYGLLALFGRTDYATSGYVLEVEAPRDCPAAERVDWRSAWRRTGVAAVGVSHAGGQ
jgi:hypothetical protein